MDFSAFFCGVFVPWFHEDLAAAILLIEQSVLGVRTRMPGFFKLCNHRLREAGRQTQAQTD